MKPILILTLALLTGCSAFQPKQQKLVLSGHKQSVQITAYSNDREVSYITNVPTTIYVDRDKSVTVSRKENGNLTYVRTISPVQSVWGKLDTLGIYFLYPGIGLFTPGYFELETDNLFLDR